MTAPTKEEIEAALTVFKNTQPGDMSEDLLDIIYNAASGYLATLASPPAPAVAQMQCPSCNGTGHVTVTPEDETELSKDDRRKIDAAWERHKAAAPAVAQDVDYQARANAVKAAYAERDAALAENARLREERDAALGDEGHDYLAERDRAESTAARLVEALKPFAKRARDIGQPDYGMPILKDHHRVDVKLGECRKAAATLAEYDKGDGNG